MARTPNLNLAVIDRSTEATTKLVGEWIDDINDFNSGNMPLIDAAFGVLQGRVDDVENAAEGLDTAIENMQGEIDDIKDEIIDIENTLDGVATVILNGALLARVIDGTTSVARSLFALGTVFVANKTLVADVEGTLGVYVSDDGAINVNIMTLSTSPVGVYSPMRLGNVATNADLPLTVDDATTLFGRTPNVDNYARVLADETMGDATIEWYILNIDGTGVITWGNPIVINAGDFQAPTTSGDAGLLLTGGATPGTFGQSVPIETTPTAGSNNPINSGSVHRGFNITSTALQMADRIYQGVNLATLFATEIAASPFNGDPWAWIQARIRANNFEGIHVGDFIDFSLTTGQQFRAEVAGINTYRLYGDAAVPNHIDFITRDCHPDTFVWNRVNFNNGTTVSPSPWLASEIYARLNSLAMNVPSSLVPDLTAVDFTTTGIYDKLPAALQNVIIQKRALLPNRFTAGSVLTDDVGWAWQDIGFLWLPSEMEVYGTNIWGSNVSPNQGLSTGGFVHYPIFATNMKRVKGAGFNGGRTTWWLLSVGGGHSTAVSLVGDDGVAHLWNASGLSRVPLCFRVA